MGEGVIEVLFTLIVIAFLVIRALKSLFEQGSRGGGQRQGGVGGEYDGWPWPRRVLGNVGGGQRQAGVDRAAGRGRRVTSARSLLAPRRHVV